MGPCGLIKQNQQCMISYQKSDFKLLQRMGQGSFGDVWKVQNLKTKQLYTLKIMEKLRVISKKSVKAIMEEKNILAMLQQDNNKFVVNLKAAFQDTEKLYLLLNYIQGRDLRYSLNSGINFDQNQIKFLVTRILKILEYLRSKKVIHRDLKPENIIIDQNGFPHLVDFGTAEIYKTENYSQNGGTLEYIAPEILLNQDHTYSADYYALGVMTFELFFGKKPFLGQNQKILLQKIYKKKLNIQSVPTFISEQGADFLMRLLEKKQRLRLGFWSFSEILKHPWINQDYTSPAKYSESDTDSPIKQKITSLNSTFTDYKLIDQSNHKQNEENIFSSIIYRSHVQQLFQKFDFIAVAPLAVPLQLTKKQNSLFDHSNKLPVPLQLANKPKASFQLDHIQTQSTIKNYIYF